VASFGKEQTKKSYGDPKIKRVQPLVREYNDFVLHPCRILGTSGGWHNFDDNRLLCHWQEGSFERRIVGD